MATIGIDARVLLTPTTAGIWTYTKHLINYLSQRDNPDKLVLFFNAAQGRVPKFITELGDRVDIVQTKIPNKLLRLMWRYGLGPTFENLCDRSIDCVLAPHISVIHTHQPLVTVIHDLTYERFPSFLTGKSLRWHRFVSDFSKKHSQRFIAVSHTTKRDMLKIWRTPSESISVIRSGLEPLAQRSQQEQDLLSDVGVFGRYILFLGTVEKRKNIESLLQAYAHSGLAGVDLVLAGSMGNALSRVKQEISRLQITDRVKVLGHVDDQLKHELYKGAEMFVYPSFYEGFGFPVLEAMQHSVPVICSSGGSLPEITGGAAIIVDPYDVQALAENIMALVSDKELAQDLVDRGLERVRQFDWSEHAASVASCCRETLRES